MKHYYSNVSGEILNKEFYGLIPCPCFHKDPSHAHHYKVKVVLGEEVFGDRGHVIKKLIVDCQLCKAHTVFDNLEPLQVCENDIWWQG